MLIYFMIYLLVAMNTRSIFVWLLLFPLAGLGAFISVPRIDYPKEGSIMQGVVLVSGSSDLNGFQSVEVSFRYSVENDLEGNWFLIQKSFDPIHQDTLAVWDTTTIADGNYDLRMLVYLEDGRQSEVIVKNLRVRNYSPIETVPASLPIILETKTEEVPTPTVLLRKSPTDLPPNPLQIEPTQNRRLVFSGLTVGAALIVVILIYSFLKRIRR